MNNLSKSSGGSGRENDLAHLNKGLIIQETTLEDFLPSVKPWVQFASFFLVTSFAAGVGLTAIWPYRVVVKVDGELRPKGETNVIHASVSGKIREILVRENQYVESGQTIATLDPTDLLDQERSLTRDQLALDQQLLALLKESEASYATSLVEVKKANQKLLLAEAEFKRYQILSSSGAASMSQYDEKKASYEVARSNLELAKERLLEQRSLSEKIKAQLDREIISSQSELNQLGRDLKNLEIKAPTSGIVYEIKLRNPQQLVVAGEEVASLSPTSSGLIAQVFVPSEQIDDLKPQQQADLKLSGCPYPDFGTMKASVASIAPDTGLTQAESGVEGFGRQFDGYKVNLQPRSLELVAGERRCKLRQGMKLKADIVTRRETVLQFFMRKARLTSGL